ncbi:MAG: hypothetical protein WC641_07565 [Patescibacteria group bacterium]
MRSVLFSEIVPRRVISDEEWLRLIEDRAYQVIDRANELGPESIGGYQFIILKGCGCSIDQLRPKVVRSSQGLDLKTRSVNISFRRRARGDSFEQSFVGMSLKLSSTRTIDWFEVQATASDETCELEEVKILPISPSEIVAQFNAAYLDLFRHLSHRVAASMERHLSQLKLLERLQQQLSAEDAAIESLVAK